MTVGRPDAVSVGAGVIGAAVALDSRRTPAHTPTPS